MQQNILLMRLNKLIVFIFISFLLACDSNPIYQKKDFIFGTMIEIKIYGEDKTKSDIVSSEILEEFHRLHQLLHSWEKSSITEINQAILKKQPINIDNEIIHIIKDAQLLEKKTQSLFNPAIGKLIALWGFHSDHLPSSIPNRKKIINLVKSFPRMEDISIKDHLLISKNQNVQIDLGGYAKGYSLDQAKKILRQNNIKNALINIGGNILAIGQHGSRDWVVGIQHPRAPNAIASISLKPGWSIGTSGDYQKYFLAEPSDTSNEFILVNNQRYSHLINPHTGFPENKTQSATILIPPSDNSGVLSDVLSKPLFIETKDQKITLAKKLNINHFLIIMADGSVMISQNMLNEINWYDEPDAKNIITD